MQCTGASAGLLVYEVPLCLPAHVARAFPIFDPPATALLPRLAPLIDLVTSCPSTTPRATFHYLSFLPTPIVTTSTLGASANARLLTSFTLRAVRSTAFRHPAPTPFLPSSSRSLHSSVMAPKEAAGSAAAAPTGAKGGAVDANGGPIQLENVSIGPAGEPCLEGSG